jgi:hypothetical protein
MNTHPEYPENMSNDDIVAWALRIREEENSQLEVRPWQSRNRWAWYIAIPAACLVSFFLGYGLRSANETPQNLTSHITTDTVYVHEVVHDTIYQTTDVHKPVRPRPVTAANQPPRKIGISVLEDNIRYDLLASHNDPSMY